MSTDIELLARQLQIFTVNMRPNRWCRLGDACEVATQVLKEVGTDTCCKPHETQQEKQQAFLTRFVSLSGSVEYFSQSKKLEGVVTTEKKYFYYRRDTDTKVTEIEVAHSSLDAPPYQPFIIDVRGANLSNILVSERWARCALFAISQGDVTRVADWHGKLVGFRTHMQGGSKRVVRINPSHMFSETFISKPP